MLRDTNTGRFTEPKLSLEKWQLPKKWGVSHHNAFTAAKEMTRSHKICVHVLPVMARRTSLAASSRASTEACSLYQDVCGVQIRLGASFRGPVEKLERRKYRLLQREHWGFAPHLCMNLVGQLEPSSLGLPEGFCLMDVQGGTSYPAFL